ncbi:hypothetical protein RsTz2092_05860 [Deferribacterales bacterium RsTz2092]
MTTRTIKLLFSLFFLLILLVSYLFMRILTADYARGQVGLFLYEAGVSEDNFSYSGAYANVLTGKLYLSNIKYGNSLFIGKLAVGGYKKLGNGNVVADVSASGVRYKDDKQSVSVGSFSVDDVVFSQVAFVRGDYKRVIAGVDEVSVKDVAVVPTGVNHTEFRVKRGSFVGPMDFVEPKRTKTKIKGADLSVRVVAGGNATDYSISKIKSVNRYTDTTAYTELVIGGDLFKAELEVVIEGADATALLSDSPSSDLMSKVSLKKLVFEYRDGTFMRDIFKTNPNVKTSLVELFSEEKTLYAFADNLGLAKQLIEFLNEPKRLRIWTESERAVPLAGLFRKDGFNSMNIKLVVNGNKPFDVKNP